MMLVSLAALVRPENYRVYPFSAAACFFQVRGTTKCDHLVLRARIVEPHFSLGQSW